MSATMIWKLLGLVQRLHLHLLEQECGLEQASYSQLLEHAFLNLNKNVEVGTFFTENMDHLDHL